MDGYYDNRRHRQSARCTSEPSPPRASRRPRAGTWHASSSGTCQTSNSRRDTTSPWRRSNTTDRTPDTSARNGSGLQRHGYDATGGPGPQPPLGPTTTRAQSSRSTHQTSDKHKHSKHDPDTTSTSYGKLGDGCSSIPGRKAHAATQQPHDDRTTVNTDAEEHAS